jgi:hypothetical protein
MHVSRSLLGFFLAVPLLAGCASTQVTNRERHVGFLPKPPRILVYDFAATPEDIPAWSYARDAYAGAGAPMDADQLEEGRKLGAALAEKLVEEINDMGMVAVRAQGQPAPQPDDLAIVGYFTSVDTGSAAKRMLVGFGTGTAEVGTHVEGYRMTAQGMERLGSGDVASGGAGKGPGLVVPALVTVATANPIGIAVSTAVKAQGEISGRTTDEGAAERIAEEIAKELKIKFEEQGWI